MAKIRHIALSVEDSEATAEFYTSAFGLKEVFRQRNDETSPQWAIYLTDGYINLALLPVKRPIGVDHIGFAVDDVGAALQTAVAAGAAPPTRVNPKDGRQAETFVTDPLLGIKLDLSRGWLTAVPDGPASIDTSTAAAATR
ncbi:MAG: VOC family protein [Candidatus Lustribacter sp.]|jgi:catechol 2,3-dioxygenase-like lactoylglutathione lyase family enzyme